AGAGPAGQRLAGAALPDAHLEGFPTGDTDELGVHAAGEEGMVLEARTERGERQGCHVVDEHHAVRVAHRDTRDPVLLAAHLERPVDDLAVGIHRNAPAVPDGRPHVDGDAHHAAALDLGLDGLYARIGLDPERDPADQAAIVDELGEATDAVAA